MMTSANLMASMSFDSEGSSVKRGSILGMAVTGVRNLLTVSRVTAMHIYLFLQIDSIDFVVG